MERAEQLAYLARVAPYFNLAALCRRYNETARLPIDYNNLRCAVNGSAPGRLSDERLSCFVAFLRGPFAREVLALAPAQEAALAARAVGQRYEAALAALRAQLEEEYS